MDVTFRAQGQDPRLQPECEDEEEEEEIPVTQWLWELLWEDKVNRYQIFNCGKAVFLFGLTVWAMRRFPNFQDPEKLDEQVINYMKSQQQLLGPGM